MIESGKAPLKCCESHLVGPIVLRFALTSRTRSGFRFFFSTPFRVALEVTVDIGGRGFSGRIRIGWTIRPTDVTHEPGHEETFSGVTWNMGAFNASCQSTLSGWLVV